MPTYDYRCPAGHEFSKFFRTISGAATDLPCPECGALAARRISGGAGLVFKGSGFYLTDYGKNAHRSAGPGAASSGAAAEAAAEKAGPKPDTKSESGATAPTPSDAQPKSPGSSSAE